MVNIGDEKRAISMLKGTSYAYLLSSERDFLELIINDGNSLPCIRNQFHRQSATENLA